MEKELAYHWRVMRSERPDLFEPSYEWRQNLNNNPIIPQKYKQLMMVAMACTIRYSLGIQTHARMAIEAGATKDLLWHRLQ